MCIRDRSKIVNRFKERLGTRRGLFIMIFGILSLLILFTVARAQYFVSQVRPGQGAIEQGKPAPLANPTKLATPSAAKEKTDPQPIPQALSASPHAAIDPRAETNKYVPGVCTSSVIPYATRYV